jgi:hypothetical protein
MEPYETSAGHGTGVAIDESSEDDYSSLDEELDSSIDKIRPCVQALGLSRYYAPGWTRKDGFREFYQNWYDVSNGLVYGK